MMRALKEVLEERHLKAGLHLEEEGDHFLLLKRGEETLATFSQIGATRESIQAEADRHLRLR